MRIVIPSMGRARTATTHRLVDESIFCVPEAEADGYAKLVGSARVVTHPDTLLGLPRKNNWILDNLIDDECVVMLDDDIEYVVNMWVGPGEPDQFTVDPDRIRRIIEQTYGMAEDAGAYLFGWNPAATNVKYFHALDAFKWTGWVNGSAKGFRKGHRLRYDERLVAKEDYDISLMNAYVHRYCFRDERHCFANSETFTGSGGLSLTRNSVTEKADERLLRQKWGPHITAKGQNTTRKRDYVGVSKINMKLPF